MLLVHVIEASINRNKNYNLFSSIASKIKSLFVANSVALNKWSFNENLNTA